jgi:hypothetical protein
MKRNEIIILRILNVWSFILGSVTITALGYAFIQIITGNVHSTASFEF